MSRLHAFFVPFGAVTIVLATGGLNLQTHSSPTPSSLPFVAQPVQLDDWLTEFEHQPAAILTLAIEKLDPAKALWQSVKINQRVKTDDISFEAYSSLSRGPNHCVRLETTLKTRGVPSQMLIVSDGTLLAHSLKRPGQQTQTNGMPLPVMQDKDSVASRERERLLVEKGCGGPHATLAELKKHLKELNLETGMLDGKAVIRINGKLDENSTSIPPSARLARPAQMCDVYLDAQTLTPVRIEWWGRGGLVLEIAYSEVTLNQTLSHEQCVKEFSFIPN